MNHMLYNEDRERAVLSTNQETVIELLSDMVSEVGGKFWYEDDEQFEDGDFFLTLSCFISTEDDELAYDIANRIPDDLLGGNTTIEVVDYKSSK